MPSRSHPDHPSSNPRRLAALAVTTIAALGASVLIATPAQAATTEVQILATNDFHGRILNNSTNGEAGAAVLAGAVNELRTENPNTVFAAAGDLIGASTFESFIQKDKPTIDALNAAGLEVSAVGNHELDQGYDDLVGRVMAPYDPDTNPLGGAEWQYLAANLKVRATGDDAVPATWVKEFGDVQVGFVGAVTEELPSLVSPAGIADIEVAPIVESVNAEAATLVAEGADLVVMLVHEGAPSTDCDTMDDAGIWADIINNVSPDVDAIVSGHTHLAYNCSFPVADWDAEGRAVTDRPVVSAGQYGTNLNQLVYSVDGATGEVSAKTQAILHLEDEDFAPLYTADPDVEAIVSAADADAEELGGRQLGEITADLNRGRQPEIKDGVPTGKTEDSRGVESTLGNFVADVQLWSAQQADPSTVIAFMNPGGLRADLKFEGDDAVATNGDGVVTYAEAAGVQPFANTLVNITLTGDQIRQALEQQWQPAGATRPFLKLGVSNGLEYTYDPDAAAGAHIGHVTLDGVPVDPDGSYRAVVNSFLAAGGDNFAAFAEATDKTDTGKVDLESMVDYMAAHPEVAPDLAQRSVGARLSAPPASGYAVGSTIDLQLWGLEFTTEEPPAGTVNIAIAGTNVGSAPIARTLQPLYDLVGQASLQVTVPAGVSGVVPLTITTPTGTSIDVPIAVLERAESTTLGWPNKIIAKKGSAVQYTVRVQADGVVPTGVVTIYDRSAPIATVTLTEQDNGRAKVKLPSLGRGLHLLWASYKGSDLVAPSQGPRVPLLVW